MPVLFNFKNAALYGGTGLARAMKERLFDEKRTEKRSRRRKGRSKGWRAEL